MEKLSKQKLRDPEFLEFLALKNQSVTACDLLADLASNGASRDSDDFANSFEHLTVNPAAAAAFARVYGLLKSSEDARLKSLSIFDFASRSHIRFTTGQFDYYQFLLLHFQRLDQFRKWNAKPSLEVAAKFLEGHTDWFSSFSELLSPLEHPLENLHPKDASFRDLRTSEPFTGVSGDSLVSIIMTTFKPDDDAEHAINSILNQTYGNFELIIVDDGSGIEYHQILKEYQTKDERIRLILLEKNIGTYGARNVGWLHANGRYLTGQDSDDWSHPNRLELQVKHLDRNPHVVGNYCQGVRVNEHLQLDIVDGNDPMRQGAVAVPVSMMIRRSPVLVGLGFFDSVRKAADTEFLRRIRAKFGQASFLEIEKVLYVTQVRSSSLSRTDFAPDWWHPNRQIYMTMFNRWHRKATSRPGVSLFMPLEQTRRFPAPFAFTPAARSNIIREFDLVFLGDWYSESTRQTWLLNQVHSAVAAGKKVGFAHVDGVFKRHARQGKPSNELLELYEDGQVDFVALDDKNVTVAKLVTAIEYPVFAEEKPSTLAVKKVELVKFQDSLEEWTSPAEKNARLIFGVSPEVLEETN